MTLVRSDLDAQFAITKGIGPVSIATNTTTLSAAIDMANYPGWKVLLIAATGTRTDGTYAPSLTESDTSGGAYTNVPAVSGSVANISAADTSRHSSYQPTKRFVKAQIVSTSVTTGALLTAYVILVPPAP